MAKHCELSRSACVRGLCFVAVPAVVFCCCFLLKAKTTYALKVKS